MFVDMSVLLLLSIIYTALNKDKSYNFILAEPDKAKRSNKILYN